MAESSEDTGATSQVSAADLERAWEYARNYYKNPEVIADFERLARYRPEVVHGYMTLRQAAFNTGPGAALDKKTKELIILAIEIAIRKVNPPPTGHTVRAVEAGATLEELAEVASLCIMIAGMISYQEAGRFVLREAERLLQERESR